MSDIKLNILVVIGISFSYGCYWDTVNCDQITLIIFGSKLLYSKSFSSCCCIGSLVEC